VRGRLSTLAPSVQIEIVAICTRDDRMESAVARPLAIRTLYQRAGALAAEIADLSKLAIDEFRERWKALKAGNTVQKVRVDQGVLIRFSNFPIAV
jgi:hypothetical protein